VTQFLPGWRETDSGAGPAAIPTYQARGGLQRFQSGGEAEDDRSGLASAAKPAAGNPYLKSLPSLRGMREVTQGLASSGLLDRMGYAFTPSVYPWMPSVWNRAGLAGGGLAHADAAADRRQILQVLREKGLIRRQRGGISDAIRH
jgi:hypothetical protein